MFFLLNGQFHGYVTELHLREIWALFLYTVDRWLDLADYLSF